MKRNRDIIQTKNIVKQATLLLNPHECTYSSHSLSFTLNSSRAISLYAISFFSFMPLPCLLPLPDNMSPPLLFHTRCI